MRPIEATARPVSAAASAARTVRPSAGAEPDQIEIAAGRFLLRPGILALSRLGTTDHLRWDPDTVSTHAYAHFTVRGALNIGSSYLSASGAGGAITLSGT